MPTIRLDIDAGPARSGADTYRRSADDIRKSSRQMVGETDSAGKSFTSLGSRMRAASGALTALAAGFAAFSIVNFSRSIIDETTKSESAIQALKSAARTSGVEFSQAMNAATEVASSGLVSFGDAARSVQNLLNFGFSTDQAVESLKRLTDSAAFNRQAHLGLSEAVRITTEGIKNGNSVQSDASGIAKNLSVIIQEYADSLGISTSALSEQQIVQGVYNGLMRETEGVVGNAAIAADGYQGAIARLDSAWSRFLTTLGNSGLIDAAAAALSGLGTVVDTVTRKVSNFFDEYRQTSERVFKEGIFEDQKRVAGELFDAQAKLDKLVNLSNQKILPGLDKNQLQSNINEQVVEIVRLKDEYKELGDRLKELSTIKPPTLTATTPGGIAGPDPADLAKASSEADRYIATQQRLAEQASLSGVALARFNAETKLNAAITKATADGNQAYADALEATRPKVLELAELQFRNAEATRGSGDAFKSAAKDSDEYARKLESLVDRLDPFSAATRQLQEDLSVLNAGIADQARLTELSSAAIDNYIESTFPLADVASSIRSHADELRATGAAAETTATSVDGALDVMRRGWERLDDTVGGFWRDMLTGGQSAFDALKDLALNTLAELIHAFTTRPLILQIGAALGLGGIGGAANASGLAQSGANLATGGLPNFFGTGSGINQLGQSTIYGVTGQAAPSWLNTAVGGFLSAGAGFGGNLLGNSLFGDRPGKYSDIGGGIGTAIGTAILPGIGSALGALFGNFAGGLFGRSPVPPQGQLLTSQSTTGLVEGAVDDALFAWNKFAEGAFGAVGFKNITTKGDFKIEPYEAQFAAIAEFDNAIASFLSPEEITNVRERLDGWTSSFQEGTIDLDSMVQERLGVIVSTIASGYENLLLVAGEGNDEFLARLGALSASRNALGVEAFESMIASFAPIISVAGEGVEEFGARLAALTDITKILDSDPFTDFAAAMEDSSRTTWEAAGRQRDALLDLTAAYDGSVAATQALAGASQAAYQTIINVLAEIDGARRSVDASFAGTADKLRDSVKTDEQRFSDLVNEGKGLFETIGSEVDPAKIADASKSLSSIVDAIFSLLPDAADKTGAAFTLTDRFLGKEPPEEQSAGLQEFVKSALGVDLSSLGIDTKAQAAEALAQFLDTANDRAQQQLDKSEEETKAQAELMRDAIQGGLQGAAEQFAAAAAQMQGAAGGMQAAAGSIPSEFNVTVTVDDRRRAEVGA